MENLRELTKEELKETDGGILGIVAIAFWGGLAYGYAKEKIDTGQW